MSDPNRPSSIEDLVAQGLGTLTSQNRGSQNVRGHGQWSNNTWQVVFVRDLSSNEEGDVGLRPGGEVSVALAIWDGHTGDRNGQKSVTIWHRLKLEE